MLPYDGLLSNSGGARFRAAEEDGSGLAAAAGDVDAARNLDLNAPAVIVFGVSGSVGLPGMLVVVPLLGETDLNGAFGAGRVLRDEAPLLLLAVLRLEAERDTSAEPGRRSIGLGNGGPAAGLTAGDGRSYVTEGSTFRSRSGETGWLVAASNDGGGERLGLSG